jgi:hypothetical protein
MTDALPTCPTGPHTHSLAEACALIGCESEDWVVDRVRNGTFPGRKIVRQLRFSDEDIAGIIQACAVQPKAMNNLPDEIRGLLRDGLTDRSRRRAMPEFTERSRRRAKD